LVYFLSKIWAVLCVSFDLLTLKDLGCVVCVLWFTYSQGFGLCCVGPLVYLLSKIWAVLCVSFGLLTLKDLGCVVWVLWFTFSQRFGLCCVCPLVSKDTHNTALIFERK
jgi:hypothetical protein